MQSRFLPFLIVGFGVFAGGFLFFGQQKTTTEHGAHIQEALAAKFEQLSQGGNSSCAASFNNSIPAKGDSERIQGSCCSAMSLHRYSEQVEGLKKYANIPEIPPDPYDIVADLAKKLQAHYDDTLF